MFKQRFNSLFKVITLVGVICVIQVPVTANAAPLSKEASGEIVKVKVDLSIDRFIILPTVTPSPGHDQHLNIDLYVRARGKGCSGPFKVKVEWTRNPVTDPWQLVGHAGIANLCAALPHVAKIKPVVKRHFTDDIAAGTFKKYRATIDYLNQVDEANERNNVSNAGYVAE